MMLEFSGKKVRWGTVLALALLAGCAVAPSTPPEAAKAWTARQSALLNLTDWQATGRIGVINGQEGWHAGFQWTQQDSGYRIELMGPLGQGRVRVEGDARAVRIQTADGQTQTAPDPDTLLEQAVGARLPVKGLRYWIRGLPEPPGAAPTVQIDAGGRLTRLEQNGWIIEYPAYGYAAPLSLELPERIIARRQDLSVKLVIEEWGR